MKRRRRNSTHLETEKKRESTIYAPTEKTSSTKPPSAIWGIGIKDGGTRWEQEEKTEVV